MYALVLPLIWISPPPATAWQEPLLAERAPTAHPEDELAHLVPPDAFFVARVRSLDSIQNTIATVARHAGHEAPTHDWGELLSNMGLDADVELISADRPFAFAANIAPSGNPSATFVVPVAEPQAFITSLGELAPERTCVAVGQYVVVTEVKGYTPGTAQSPIAAGLAPADIALRVDLARLIETLRPLIDMGMGQFESMVDQIEVESDADGEQIDPAPALELYFNWVEELIDCAQTLDFAATRAGDDLSISGQLTVREGSSMSKWPGGPKHDLMPAARLIDPGAAFTYVFAADMASMADWYGELLGDLLPMYPESMRGMLEAQGELFSGLYAKMGPRLVANGDFTPDGLRAEGYFEAQEPGELLASWTAQWAELGQDPKLAQGGYQLTGPTEVTLAGVSWRELRMQLDLRQMLASIAVDADADEAELAKGKQAVDAILGREGLRMAFTARGNDVVMLVNGDESRAAAALQRLEAKSATLPSDLSAALSGAGQANMATVMRMDLGQLVTQMRDIVRALDAGAADDFPAALIGKSFPLTMWCAIDGRAWRSGASLRASDLGRMIGAVSAAETAASEAK